MKRVLNTKPNAAALNSGIEFEPHPDGGMISVEAVDEETAKRFATIPGYKIVDEKEAQKAAAAKEAADKRAAKEAEAAEKKAKEDAAAQKAAAEKAANKDDSKGAAGK